MIPAKTAKRIAKLIVSNVGEEKAMNFLNTLTEISGTSNNFKMVLSDVKPYLEKELVKPPVQSS